MTGIDRTTVPKLWRTNYLDCAEESPELRLFKIVVLHILPPIIKDYKDTVESIMNMPAEEEEEKVETYMQLVRSSDIAFINVVLDLYIEELCKLKKSGRQQISEHADKKKRGKKADKESLEHKEEMYIKEVVALQKAREAKKEEGDDEKKKRIGWYREAIKLLEVEHKAEQDRMVKEKENPSEESKKRDGQQIGKEQTKKKKRRTLMGVLPNDGYQGYGTPRRAPGLINLYTPPAQTEEL